MSLETWSRGVVVRVVWGDYFCNTTSYITQRHAEQFCRALRLNGTPAVIIC